MTNRRARVRSRPDDDDDDDDSESENAHSDVVVQRRQRRAVLDDSSSESESEEEELAVVRRRRKNAAAAALDSDSETEETETEVVDLRESVGESPLAGISKPSVVIPRTTAIDVAARSSTTFTKMPTRTRTDDGSVVSTVCLTRATLSAQKTPSRSNARCYASPRRGGPRYRTVGA